jgi:neutral ceramidase
MGGAVDWVFPLGLSDARAQGGVAVRLLFANSHRLNLKPLTLLLVLLAVRAAGAAADGELQVGLGIVDITGPNAMILDPLHAKAVYFRQGPEQFVLVEVDNTELEAETTSPARRLASEKAGIPYTNICVAATHTHMDSPHKDLVTAIVEAVSQAKAAARPVKLQAGAGQQFRIAFNRRYFMKDGSVMFNPMFLNPDIVRPAGPIDPEVGILLFRNPASGRPLASLSNYAMHLDTAKEYGAVYQNTGTGSRDSVSADYPYWLEETLRKSLGVNFQSVFATGACGNINHWDFSKPGPQAGHKTTTKYLGEALASAFMEAVPKLRDETPSLAVRARTMRIPLREPTADEVAWAQQFLKQSKEVSGRSEEVSERRRFLNTVRAQRILTVEKRKQETGVFLLEVQVVRLGEDVAIVALPGEMFVEHGLTIKNLSPFTTTLIVELANEMCGYVPNRKAFPQGEYEVEQAQLAPGGGEMMVEAAVEMLHQLKQDAR